MENILTITEQAFTLAITPEAESFKAELIAQAQEIQIVESESDVARARNVCKSLANFRTTLEKSRKATKEPVLDAGRKIDEAAASFGESVANEEKRLSSAVTAFAAEQERKKRQAAEEARRIAEEAARKAREEVAAIEREKKRIADEAANAERLAKAALQQAEEERNAERIELLKSQHAMEAAAARETEMARRLAEEAKLRSEAEARLADLRAKEAEYNASVQVAGTKSVTDFEIENIAALAFCRPDLVEITPKRSAILAEIREARKQGKEIEITGIRIIERLAMK